MPHRVCPTARLVRTKSADTIADILEYSNIAWPNSRMFTDTQKKASRTGQPGSRLSGVAGHEAHSHSPQRPPPIASRGQNASLNDSYRKALSSQQYDLPRPDCVGKGSSLGELQNVSPEHGVAEKIQMQVEDPFVSAHHSPAAIQHWRSMLRSTSRDVSMPDYSSSKSIFNTEMSGVSATRASFEKQVNEAHPDEIVDALTPLRREQLLKILSASNSPATGLGTRAPTNTPQTSSGSKNCKTDHEDGLVTNVLGPAHARLWREARQRPRRASESASGRSTSEPITNYSKVIDSPPVLQGLNVAVGGNLAPVAASRTQSLTFGRQRSTSSGSKRKRQSGSPPPGTKGAIRVVVDTPTSSASDKQ